MKTIELTNGGFTIVSNEDFEKVSSFKWYKNNCGYVGRTSLEKGKFVFLHKVILEGKKGFYVDHIDGNTLNNTRQNLRHLTPQQSILNRGMNKNNKSGFRGVSWDKFRKRWRAVIMLNRKYIQLGRFKNMSEAISAYKLAAKEYHGEYARNTPY